MLPNIIFKDGVVWEGLHLTSRELVRAAWVCQETAPPMLGNYVCITSLRDGKHKAGSLHYLHKAFDVRCWNIDDGVGTTTPWARREGARQLAGEWSATVQSELGEDYDVLFEEKWITRGVGQDVLVPHMHVEFDTSRG